MRRRTLVSLAAAALAALSAVACGGEQQAAEPPHQQLRSRPDLKPPKVTVITPARDTTPGYVFFAPKKMVAQAGPMIVDNQGRMIWFRPLSVKGIADFRVQRYRDRPVLTWWRGAEPKRGIGAGYYVIIDSSYRGVAEVRAGNGLSGDIHEFVITPRNTALFTIYNRLPRDLRDIGGPREGRVVEGVVQEVDIPTGRVLFEWHSIEDVEPSESYWPAPPAKRGAKAAPYDYFHINSVREDTDGNLLISARNTRAVYKISRRDGSIIWRLNGKKSDFAMGPGTRFAWQHDAQRQPDGTLTLFDNSAAPKTAELSRVLVLRLDTKAKEASLVRSYAHPKKLLSDSQGNAQFLPNGHVFVGWGSNAYFTEYDENGKVIFDARFGGKEVDSYRAYRFRWTGHPNGPPEIAARREDDRVSVWASWNGATEVARWRVLAGSDPESLRPAGEASWSGFETRLSVPGDADFVAVQALGRRGQVLRRSRTVEPAG